MFIGLQVFTEQTFDSLQSADMFWPNGFERAPTIGGSQTNHALPNGFVKTIATVGTRYSILIWKLL